VRNISAATSVRLVRDSLFVPPPAAGVASLTCTVEPTPVDFPSSLASSAVVKTGSPLPSTLSALL
jgi:hypothetical protein